MACLFVSSPIQSPSEHPLGAKHCVGYWGLEDGMALASKCLQLLEQAGLINHNVPTISGSIIFKKLFSFKNPKQRQKYILCSLACQILFLYRIYTGQNNTYYESGSSASAMHTLCKCQSLQQLYETGVKNILILPIRKLRHRKGCLSSSCSWEVVSQDLNPGCLTPEPAHLTVILLPNSTCYCCSFEVERYCLKQLF